MTTHNLTHKIQCETRKLEEVRGGCALSVGFLLGCNEELGLPVVCGRVCGRWHSLLCVDLSNHFVTEDKHVSGVGGRILVNTLPHANEQIVNLLDHLRVKPLGKHGADGQHKLTKVSDRSRASKNLCCVVTLAALDLLHACRVLLGFLFLASDSEDVVHDHGHELRQTRVQITRLELIGIGDE